MRAFDYCIVGGGVAGTTAAQTIRQHDAAGSIAIVSDEPHRFYSRIMLSKPNFFLGEISFDHIWLKTPEWYQQNRLTLIAGRTAVTLTPQKQLLTLDDDTSLRYGKLLVAIGGWPNRLPIPGADKRGVQYLRTLDDARALIKSIKTAKRAICIGGGFVSFEMCEMLLLAGISVTLVIREPHYWDPVLDQPSGQMVERVLERAGVRIVRRALVKTVDGGPTVTGVTLDNGMTIPGDLVVAGLGVYTPHAWISAAGVAVKRGIITNEFLETNVPNVWAAGDCAEFKDLILDEQVQLGNWVNAQQLGKVAGLGMVGRRQPFQMVSFYTTQGFGIAIGFVGDVRPAGRQMITRGSPAANAYARLLVDDHDELVGATLINRTAELGYLCRLIERNVKVSPIKDKLADAKFELKNLTAAAP